MATIKDIARLAKVTPSTVSRVLNHSGGYSEKTRRRVEKIADELHYQKTKLPLIWLHRPQI
ncbi:LacI family DNA-binding transcriptional regulator [Limosilactobacillus fermentum]|nr:LacI family DNA-binding transcriptional regulator [Limosilactobacillus fermentum]